MVRSQKAFLTSVSRELGATYVHHNHDGTDPQRGLWVRCVTTTETNPRYMTTHTIVLNPLPAAAAKADAASVLGAQLGAAPHSAIR